MYYISNIEVENMMTIEWLHEENGIKTPVEVPVKIERSVNSGYGFGGNLICNKCNSQLKQLYVCSCGEQATIGQIKNRRDKIKKKVIYCEEDRQNFMETKITDRIRVEKEITREDILDNLYFLDTPYEIYNNDDVELQGRIKQIHNFLHKKGIILLVSLGYHGKEMGGIIIPTKDQLSLITLRDYNLIKAKNQIGLDERTSKIDMDLEAITESSIPKLHKEFIKAVEENKPILKPEIIERKPKMIEIGFLEGY